MAGSNGGPSLALLKSQLKALVTSEKPLSNAGESKVQELKRLLGAAFRFLEEPTDTIKRVGFSVRPLLLDESS